MLPATSVKCRNDNLAVFTTRVTSRTSTSPSLTLSAHPPPHLSDLKSSSRCISDTLKPPRIFGNTSVEPSASGIHPPGLPSSGDRGGGMIGCVCTALVNS